MLNMVPIENLPDLEQRETNSGIDYLQMGGQGSCNLWACGWPDHRVQVKDASVSYGLILASDDASYYESFSGHAIIPRVHESAPRGLGKAS